MLLNYSGLRNQESKDLYNVFKMDFRDLCAETFHILDKETEARGDKGLIVGRTA